MCSSYKSASAHVSLASHAEQSIKPLGFYHREMSKSELTWPLNRVMDITLGTAACTGTPELTQKFGDSQILISPFLLECSTCPCRSCSCVISLCALSRICCSHQFSSKLCCRQKSKKQSMSASLEAQDVVLDHCRSTVSSKASIANWTLAWLLFQRSNQIRYVTVSLLIKIPFWQILLVMMKV